MSAEKLCVDCRHYKGGFCVKWPSLADGGRSTRFNSYPELSRDCGWFGMLLLNACGRKARWFEPRQGGAQ